MRSLSLKAILSHVQQTTVGSDQWCGSTVNQRPGIHLKAQALCKGFQWLSSSKPGYPKQSLMFV